MKITHKSKKAIPPPPQLAEFISKLIDSSNEDLLQTLKQVPSWKWPRSDLNAWIKVLDKFDDIMDSIIQEYNVDKLQLNPFAAETKELLAEILRFERLLLENSTNRKSFSSYDRLNDLLSTSDLDILILALNLLLRPSQQYSTGLAHTHSLPTSRLQSLAKKWPYLREHGIGLVDLTSSQGPEDLEGIPAEARAVSFSFYRADSTNVPTESKSDDVFESSGASPQKPSASNSNAVLVEIDEQTILAKPALNVLADAIQEHSIPETETFELLCRIRAARVLATGKKAEREKLVVVRLLALAIFGHTHNESHAASALFLYEPDLISHVAELLQVDRGIPIIVQTAAIAALDAIARYKSKVQEVLTAVNAGVNHGLLMTLVRFMVSEVGNPESTLPHSFIEALLSFITYIASHASGGNMIVGAGLLPVLIQIMENKSASRLAVISKTMQLVDNVLYSFANAFTLFCAARGVEVLVERIEFEIDYDIKEYAKEIQDCSLSGSGDLPIQRIAVLKHILRSMHRMMQSSGTAEGLRGLIDTSLIKSIKKVFQYRGFFGPNVFHLAINIMSTFVHNEPTSLAIIQEAGLPELFYKAIEVGIEPAIEVIQAIPNAIGALCLNEVGQAQLAKRPSVIPSIFSIFTSERHVKVLIDKEHAVIVGSAVDELIRHHPSLKACIFASLSSTLTHIKDLGLAYIPPDDIKHWYRLMPMSDAADVDVPMNIEASTEMSTTAVTPAPNRSSETNEDDDGGQQVHDNSIVNYIDIIGRFLEGLFQYMPHCKDFVTTTSGLQEFGALTALPCLPYDFANTVGSDSMVQVLRTMTEAAPSETLHYLSDIVTSSLADTKFFRDPIEEHSKLLNFVDLPRENEELANYQFRCLVVLHVRLTLLSDVFSTASQSQGRAAITLLQTLMTNMPVQVLSDLGTLHRAGIWENITLKVGLASKGIDVQVSALSSPAGGSPNTPTLDLPSVDAPPSVNGANSVNGSQTEAVLPSTRNNNDTAGSSKSDTPRDWNAASVKHFTQELPSALGNFFQSMVKMFHARRNPDPSQKKQITESSKILADIMASYLLIRNFDDKTSLYSYYSMVFSLFTMLLIDERTTTNTLHTVQVYAFYQAGGFEAIFDVCNDLITSIEDLVAIPEEDRTSAQKSDLLHAYSALKVTLHLLHPLVSSKPLFESGQTQLIMTRDKPETDPDYFEPHHFLVKIRTVALPTVRRLWEATWLIQAPIGLSRNVVRTVLEIANGENEEAKVSPLADLGPPPSGIPVMTRPQTVGPDEGRIRLLTDMGFPRSAAERALIRTHNNVNSATEILLSHPFPYPPDPEPEFDPDAVPALELATRPPDAIEASNVSAPIIPSADTSSTPAVGDEAAPAQSGKTVEEWRKELDEAREPLKASISKQSLLLIDEHLSLLFDLHIAFTKPSSHQPQAIQALVDDIEGFLPFAYTTKEQPLANRCRLLALVLCERPSSFEVGLRENLMGRLLELLASSTYIDHTPKWLASHLLVTEALFTLGDEPRTIELSKEGEPITAGPISVGPTHPEAKSVVFERCVQLLAISDLPTDEFLSVLRLIVLLTRDRDMAAQFIQKDGWVSILERVRNSPVAGASSYIATILRHVVEDSSIIQSIMQQTIKRYFAQPRTRIVDVATFVRNCNAIALRDIDLFIDTTKSLCDLEQPYESAVIKLKAESPAVEPTTGPVAETSTDMQVDTSPMHQMKASQKPAETVVHLLISELMNVVKVINETPSNDGELLGAAVQRSESDVISTLDPPLSSEPALTEEASETDTASQATNTPDTQDKTQYACFLMQCLTELLFSYESCKTVFLSYSNKKKSQQTPGREQNNRFRMVILQFLLSELVTYGTVNPSPDSKHRRQSTLCSWATNVISALCTDTSITQDAKDTSSELTFVRKFVLETISRSVKDLSSTAETTEARYGRLMALADLCNRLVAVRPNSPPSRKHQDEAPTQVAKIMLEKNFVAIFTTALSEVDLNFPNVRNVVASVLRPLEFLTKIAIKMSKISNKTKEDAVKDFSVSSESSDDDESMDDETREETPDLYRNSALGMYGGEMDDGQYSEGEDMDDDDDEQDVDMEYGDETGSEDTSESGSEGEDDIDHVTHHNSGEGWEEEDEEEEEDLVENEDDDDEQNVEQDEDHEDQEEDDEEDEEDRLDPDGIWEHMQQEAADMGLTIDHQEDEGGHGVVPIQVIHEEDEPEMASDEEEYMMEHETYAHDVNGTFPHSNLRDHPLFYNRRPRGNDVSNFGGRPRNPVAAPEATTHPLLLDMSAANRANADRSRTRGPPRLIHGGPNLIQTLDQMLSGGSLQMLQHLMAHQEGLNVPLPMLQDGATFRIELPPDILQHGRRLFNTLSRVDRIPRSQPPRQGREFEPLLTLQRWAEEMKILHGDFVNERIGKLVNHVILAMLPAALDAMKKAAAEKEARELEAKEQEAKEAEDAKSKAPEPALSVDESIPALNPTGSENNIAAGPADGSDVIASTEQRTSDPVQDTAMVDIAPGDVDEEMVDASQVANETSSHSEPPASNTEVGEASSSADTTASLPERVTVMIHGSAVDITNTGIDPTFLEALPDDMREEVLNQHVRDQQASQVNRPPDSQISSEFLDALPPEIRAEIIQQEAMERARIRSEDAARPARDAADIDPATFIATLDPSLRQAVLLDQDDGFIRSLPSHMVAEAGAYRDQANAGLNPNTARRGRHIPQQQALAKKHPLQHDAIQLLDRASVAVLVRLLFYPQVLKKNLLFKVLVNLCENAKTRVELFNILLSILQEGTADVTAVDKSFAQMSVRSRDHKLQTPKAAGKQKANESLAALALPTTQLEAVPDLIAQRCLEALTNIVAGNELSSLFFLTEHELPAGLRKAVSKKGKGKEKQSQTHYPLVLLLNLLDRPSLLRTPSILESVVGLLASVTRPLTTLKDQNKTESSQSTSAATEPLATVVGSSSAMVSTESMPAASSIEEPVNATPLPTDAVVTIPVENTAESQPVKSPEETAVEKPLLTQPPQVPDSALRLIVNILTIGECSGRTFQQSLALIQNLSNIPDSRDVIANELKARAQEFGQTLYSDLDELATALQDSNVLVSSVAAKFSPASSTQAKLLRVLKTIDYMYTPKNSASSSSSAADDDVEKVQSIYESFRFTPLWRRLGDCLVIIGENPEMTHVSTVLLPLIESLMVVCKFVGSKNTAPILRALRSSSSPQSPTTPRESMEELFISFTDAHRKILNVMVRNNPSLMSGSFSLLVNNSRVLDFDNKRNYFNQQLHKKPHAREHYGTLQLNIRRARVFEDSFLYLQRKTGEQIKHGKLSVRFYDEEGVDAGGLTREWFQILARQMFNPNNALFQPCAADKLTYQPNKNSWVNPEHLSFFKFVGRVIGKAIYDGRLLDAYFARSLYRQLLGKPVDYRDVEWVDPEYYKSLCWILENDPTVLDMNFSVEADEFGVNRIVPLKEGGEGIAVTQENKREFVQLSAQYRLYSSIKDQIESLSSGFYEIIPKDLITIFNEQELELLISGTPDIDVDEWRSATEYNGYTSSDPNIVWWWRALKSFNREERAKVLSFATGTSRVPLSGFLDLQGVQGVQKFSIHRAYGAPDRLPQAHTCFNQIDLPHYTSYEMLRQQLLMAIHEGGEGFAFS